MRLKRVWSCCYRFFSHCLAGTVAVWHASPTPASAASSGRALALSSWEANGAGVGPATRFSGWQTSKEAGPQAKPAIIDPPSAHRSGAAVYAQRLRTPRGVKIFWYFGPGRGLGRPSFALTLSARAENLDTSPTQPLRSAANRSQVCVSPPSRARGLRAGQEMLLQTITRH